MMMLAGTAAAATALDILSSLKELAFPSEKREGATKTKFGLSDSTEAPALPADAAAQLGNGTISADTMRALLAMQAQPGAPIGSFARLDRDGNGRMNKSEFDEVVTRLGDKASPSMRFESLDKDQNGEISETEFADAMRQHTKKKNGVTPAHANVFELFQRMQSQHSDMLANAVAGKSVAVSV